MDNMIDMVKTVLSKTNARVNAVVAFSVIAIAAAAGTYFVGTGVVPTNELPSVVTGGCGDGYCSEPERLDPNLCPKDCATTTSANAFIAVHMEPGLGYAQKYWPSLVSLVAAADRYNIKLTLQFNPQWGTIILNDPAKLKQLRGWEENGHEIALHHHGPSHNSWNGYTNRTDLRQDPRYRGTVADMMRIIRRLPADGVIATAGATDEETDWPYGVPFDTNGGPSPDHLLSEPTVIDLKTRGLTVTQLKYRMYAVNTEQAAPLSEIEAAYASQGDRIMGIVFHVHDFTDREQAILDLFDSLRDNGIKARSVEDIMSDYTNS